MAMEGTYDTDMPSRYDSEAGGRGNSTSSGTVDMDFVKSPKGILKAVQTVLSLVAFICAVASQLFLSRYGGGWVAFVTMSAFILNVVWYIVFLLRVIDRLPKVVPWTFVLFVYNVVYAVLYFTAGIVCAVRGGIPAAAAGAVFCFIAMAAFGVECYFSFQDWRASGEGPAIGGGGGGQQASSPPPQEGAKDAY